MEQHALPFRGRSPLQSASTLISVFRHTNITSNKNLFRPRGSAAPSGLALGQAKLSTNSGTDPVQEFTSLITDGSFS